jgi:capsular exopolysaccharide synthesis family protein
MSTTNTSDIARRILPEESLSIVDMLMVCLRHWPWFILSVLLCMGAATLYLLHTPKTFTRTTSILVKSSGNKSNDIRLIEDLGVNNISSDIADEIVAIHSPAVVYDLVKRLRLDFSYYRPGFFRDDVLYAATLPVEVEIDSLEDNTTASFQLTLNGDGSATLTDIVLRGETVETPCRVAVGKKCKSPLGVITVKPTLYFKKDQQADILVRRTGFNAAASRYGGMITASLQPGTRNIIDVRCVDTSIPRAENILKTVVNIYNENWVQNRNQVSVSTNEFIKERLAVIESELGDVEGTIASYKSSHGMLSVEQAASQAVGKEAAADQQRQAISNQLYMIRYVRNYVSDPSHAKQLMPASTGIGNSAIEGQIAAYNNRILERNNLVSNSSEQNPLVTDLDQSLDNLRGAILNSLDNAQMTLNTQMNTVQAAHGAALSRLTAAPQQKNHLLSFERQQKVKESLYLFLLQKREENELSQAFTAYNTRIIANPYGSSVPTSPNQNQILLIAFALALAVPAAFFILRENLNSKVRGRKDLENLSIPYVGELPLWKPKKGEETTTDGYRFVVRQHSRDIVNEAYRVVRTNLEFMTNQEKQCKIIMLTSFNPGSGKTFITANLGASFAIRGSRVICIDLDLRRGSLSEFVDKPKHGLTSYLGGRTDTYADLIVHHELNGNGDGNAATIDFLPMGKIPPNPTELLYSPKLKPMLDELRQQYDYIFVDCPPVEIVADATIISHEADVTLFVVRAGLLERTMLPELQKNYDEKKYNNMAMILNGTDAEHHYGYRRYGYGYGRYGYGKRYGYGYYGSSGSKSKKKS